MTGRTNTLLRAWLVVQLAVSIAANELGADHSLEARLVAPIAPLILFGSIESMLWIPGRPGFVGVMRAATTIAIGAGAAILSFDSIGRFGAAAGLDELERAILALIIDGGILVVGLTLLMNREADHDPPPEPVPAPRASGLTGQENNHTSQTRSAPTHDKRSDPGPDTSEHNLPTGERRRRVAAAAAIGDPDVEILANRFGVSTRTIRRDLDEREGVLS